MDHASYLFSTQSVAMCADDLECPEDKVCSEGRCMSACGSVCQQQSDCVWHDLGTAQCMPLGHQKKCICTINTSYCGNNKTEPGEECDDGNTNDADGCSSVCTCENKDNDRTSACGPDKNLNTWEDNDCDDSNPFRHPWAVEVCDNNVDDNCNGEIDEGCFTWECRDGDIMECWLNVGICEPGIKRCRRGAWTDCTWWVQALDEVCDDLDNNCDGFVDEWCDTCTGTEQKNIDLVIDAETYNLSNCLEAHTFVQQWLLGMCDEIVADSIQISCHSVGNQRIMGTWTDTCTEVDTCRDACADNDVQCHTSCCTIYPCRGTCDDITTRTPLIIEVSGALTCCTDTPVSTGADDIILFTDDVSSLGVPRVRWAESMPTSKEGIQSLLLQRTQYWEQQSITSGRNTGDAQLPSIQSPDAFQQAVEQVHRGGEEQDPILIHHTPTRNYITDALAPSAEFRSLPTALFIMPPAILLEEWREQSSWSPTANLALEKVYRALLEHLQSLSPDQQYTYTQTFLKAAKKDQDFFDSGINPRYRWFFIEMIQDVLKLYEEEVDV